MCEIEKQFFDTFGIEPIPYCCYHDCNCPINDAGKFNSKCPKQAVTKECDARIIKNPQITDHILLELICLTGNTGYFLINNEGSPIDVKGLKNSVLHALIIYSKFHKDLKHKVQELFMEGI